MRTLFACLIVSLLSGSADAQDLYRRDAIELAPLGPNIGLWKFLAEDAAGYRYYQGGQSDALGVIDCLHPDNPEDTHRSFVPEAANGDYSVAVEVAADGQAVDIALAFRLMQGDGNGERVRLFRWSCADAALISTPIAPVATLSRGDSPYLEHAAAPEFTRASDGRYCFAANRDSIADDEGGVATAIVCATLGGPVIPLVESATLDLALSVNPGDAGAAIFDQRPPEFQWWTLSAPRFVPDGRLFFFADRTYVSHESSPNVRGSYSVRYVVERATDGTLTRRYTPVLSLANGAVWNPIVGARTFLYSAELNAVLAWPVLYQEYDRGFYTPYDGPLGWTGVGFRVFSLDDAGNGYLGIAAPAAQAMRCSIPFQCDHNTGPSAALLRDGRIGVNLPEVTAGERNGTRVFALDLDVDALDLDDDGVSAAEERAQGTSDTQTDSDRDGVSDGIEARAGTDPARADSHPSATTDIGRITYAASPLIRQRLPPDGDYRGSETATSGIDAPLCTAGSCYDASGQVVMRYRDDDRVGPVVTSRDGAFVVVPTAAGLERHYLADDRQDLLIDRATLDATLPGAAERLRVIAVNAGLSFLVRDGLDGADVAQIAVVDARGVRVVYDHAAAQRASGLPLATAGERLSLVADGVEASFTLSGYIAELGELQIGVRGTWDTWLIGVSADGVVVRERGRSLAGLGRGDWFRLLDVRDWYAPLVATSATAAVPTGHGDYFTLGGVMTPFGTYRETLLNAFDCSLNAAPLAIWGDTLIDRGACPGGPYELVRYDQRAVAGDVWVLMQVVAAVGDEGVMLYRSGPRGGLAPLWSERNSTIRDVTGMDLTPTVTTGAVRLCVADAASEAVWELEPASFATAPEVIRYAADVADVRDCAYDGDGQLVVLAGDPPALWRRDGEFGELVLDAADARTVDSTAYGLVRRPDGAIEVLDASAGLRGKSYLSDGRAVTMADDSFTLQIAGEDVAPVPRLLFQNARSSSPEDWPARVELAARADGMIVVAAHSAHFQSPFATNSMVFVVDPREASVTQLGVGDYIAQAGVGVVVVPGGSGADPWTSRVDEHTPATPDIDAPTIPEAPSGGTALPDGGCAGAGASSWWLMWVLAGAMLRWRLGSGRGVQCRRQVRCGHGAVS